MHFYSFQPPPHHNDKAWIRSVFTAGQVKELAPSAVQPKFNSMFFAGAVGTRM